MLSEPQLFKLI